MTEPDAGAVVDGAEADRTQLDHSEQLIEEAKQAAPAALPDTAGEDDLDGPRTGPGLADDEPVTRGPN